MVGIYFNIRGERAGLYTLMLMCGRTPSLSNLTTFIMRELELTFDHIIEDAIEKVGSKKVLPPSGALAEVIERVTEEFESPYDCATLEKIAIQVSRSYRSAHGLDETPATSPEEAFWTAVSDAAQRERGAFVRPWFPDVAGAIAINPPAAMPEEFWKALSDDVERKKAQYGPLPAVMSRAEQLEEAEEQEVAYGVYGYPMLSGLMLYVIATLDLNHTEPGDPAPVKRRKAQRRRHWASENLASRLIERWTIGEQLIALGQSRDINETTLRRAFSKWDWVAPLWAAAIVEADCWDEKSAPFLSGLWMELKYNILPSAERLEQMFQKAKWFSNFAAGYKATNAPKVLIPEAKAIRLPETLGPIKLVLRPLSEDALRGMTKRKSQGEPQG